MIANWSNTIFVFYKICDFTLWTFMRKFSFRIRCLLIKTIISIHIQRVLACAWIIINFFPTIFRRSISFPQYTISRFVTIYRLFRTKKCVIVNSIFISSNKDFSTVLTNKDFKDFHTATAYISWSLIHSSDTSTFKLILLIYMRTVGI